MNRKHNPWVALVALILLVTILVMTCTGCAPETEAETMPRFTCEDAGWIKSVGNLYIITDTRTGVQYLLTDVPNGAGLTVLQPGAG